MEFTSGYIMTRYCDASRLLRHRSIGSTADNATSTPTIDAERARLRRIRLGRTSVSAQHSPGWKVRSRSRASFDDSRT